MNLSKDNDRCSSLRRNRSRVSFRLVSLSTTFPFDRAEQANFPLDIGRAKNTSNENSYAKAVSNDAWSFGINWRTIRWIFPSNTFANGIEINCVQWTEMMPNLHSKQNKKRFAGSDDCIKNLVDTCGHIRLDVCLYEGVKSFSRFAFSSSTTNYIRLITTGIGFHL